MIREALEAREAATEAPAIDRDLFRRVGSSLARRIRPQSAEEPAPEPEDQDSSLQGTPPVSHPTRQ